ncbi:hypothetical protein [Yoonia sp. SS1-5]|uniref:Porin n=2 Tax=Yoonia rhodophyticola TaxID=3137370 RepID=A0AAN0MDK3_9RHOB
MHYTKIATRCRKSHAIVIITKGKLMIRTITTTAILALTAGTAMADGLNYARFSYDLNNFSDDSGADDIKTSVFQGEFEYSIDQFVLGANLTNFAVDVSDESSLTVYDVWAGFVATPEIMAGLGLTGASFGDEDTNGAEFFGQYTTDQFGIGVRVAQLDFEEDNISTILNGQVSVTPEVELGAVIWKDSEFDGTGYMLSTDYDNDLIDARAYYQSNTEAESGFFAVRGSYKVADMFRISALYETVVGDEEFDVSFYTIGGGYEFVDGAWIDVNYGQIDFGDEFEKVDRIQAAISFEMGDRLRLDNQFEQDTTDDSLMGSGSYF